MKLSAITASPRRSGRVQRKGAMSGGYNWELATLVFGDPIAQIGKGAKARAQSRARWKAQGSKARAKKSERNDYHRKHG